MSARTTKTRQAQMCLRLDEVPSPLIEIWDCLPRERQLRALSVLARLVARLRQPKGTPDES
jgi:hypothetical protein